MMMRLLFERLGGWLAGFIGIKTAEVTSRLTFLGAVISLYIALYVAFMGSIVAVVSFSPVTPTGNVAAGLALLPGNIGQCMSAIGSAHVIAQVYLMKTKIIKLGAK